MAAKKTKKSLVIVESPAKAKTIQKYLGPGFEVAASKGHVRDLPKSKLGIEIEQGWIPSYRPLEDRKALLTSLKKSAKAADIVYLAPDPDREGEAIAWHLKEALGLKDENVRRVTFNEITKKAVQDAFASPRAIDMDKVSAQEARRFLDRVVGYQLSPLISRRLAQQLSAGRVQSVAVRLIVEREREIQAFKAEEYWKIEATLTADKAGGKSAEFKVKLDKKDKSKTKQKEEDEAAEALADGADGEVPVPAEAQELPKGAFVADLVQWKGEKFACSEEKTARAIGESLQKAAYKVSQIEEKERQDRAPPPFTTSTLQQQAAMRLGYSARRTMSTAQRLYEGVDLGSEGSVALITYMRTDSTRVSEDALKAVRIEIEQKHGKNYIPDKPNRYTSGKSAQEAHEAIRPTDLSWTPQRVTALLQPEQAKLYALIYNRFMASQMKPAVYQLTTATIEAGEGQFRATGRVLQFDGWRKLFPGSAKGEEATLPALKVQAQLGLLDLLAGQHFTQPPPRFNEASLVRTLEKEGIGRPSTYATIISKIQERGYVEQKERRFYASEIGMKVTDLLVERFPHVMEMKFTSHMEGELDRIETDHIPRNQVLDEFYGSFQEAVGSAKEAFATSEEKCPKCGKPLTEKFSRRGRFFGCTGYPECNYIKRPGQAEGEEREKPKVTEFPCPTCGKFLVERNGKNGPFLGCSGYPECKTVMNIGTDGQPVAAVKPTGQVCEKCGKEMVIREGRRGPFLACSGYPKCKNAKDVDAEGKPVEQKDLGIACEKCGAPMAIRRGPRGPFLGCTAYPKCRSTKQITAELKEKLGNALPPPAPKKQPLQVEVTETCVECGGPMALKAFRGRYFLGCAAYPKCKSTAKVSPELAERIKAAEAAAAAAPPTPA